MSFVLVGYPVVAPNYFQHDPLDQPPHPVLAEILRTVAASQQQAQIATFMAVDSGMGDFKYFNHAFMNGAVNANVIKAAESQAASIMTAAAEQASVEPYMSVGRCDDYHSTTGTSLKAPPIEKYDSSRYRYRYDYYYDDDDDDEDDVYVSDVDKAVQQQVDQLEAVCSSSSYDSPYIIEDDRSQRHGRRFSDYLESSDISERRPADVIENSPVVTQQQSFW